MCNLRFKGNVKSKNPTQSNLRKEHNVARPLPKTYSKSNQLGKPIPIPVRRHKHEEK